MSAPFMAVGLLLVSGGPWTDFERASPVRPEQLPEIVVTEDDTVIDRSCRVVIPPGTVIVDAAGDGVIKVTGADVTIEFAPGSVLRGAPAGAEPDGMSGVGIRLVDVGGASIRGAHVSGFKAGIYASRTPGLTLEQCDVSGNFRQHLRSTPAAEDQSDWLWPHRNDGNEWLTNYGAGMYVEDCRGVTVRGCRAREGQNGLIIDRVNESEIYDNDFSFLSGWGLAMWRSSGNTITRNALDFCIRGYSHGVYNRGQDSAGILMFEQCSRNVIAENSATHGGDGFFGFGGHEALGEVPPPNGAIDFDYAGRGCNENLFWRNDFSYAAAHGLELTFSFDNRIVENRLSHNNICGIWGGYSQRTLIESNEIHGNGPGAPKPSKGGEGGGINIEHGHANRIVRNDFDQNTVDVSLNVTAMLLPPGMEIDHAAVPILHWQSGLFGRGTQSLVLRNQLSAALASLDRELQVVGEIQRSLLPRELPTVSGFELAAYYLTSARAGGDYYDFFPLANDGLGLFIADVSGHGTPAAVFMAITHAIAHTQPGTHTPPDALLTYLNAHLARTYTHDGTFVTAFYAVLDPGRRTLTYSAAGHNPPRVVRAGRVIGLDQASGLPLGIIEDQRYSQTTVQLEPNDLVVFYTDGITEAMGPTDANGSRPLFGVERLDQVLIECAGNKSEACIDRVKAAVAEFTGGAPATDDRTLIAMQCE